MKASNEEAQKIKKLNSLKTSKASYFFCFTINSRAEFLKKFKFWFNAMHPFKKSEHEVKVLFKTKFFNLI